MLVTLTGAEALTLALRAGPLPPGVGDVRVHESTVTAQVDLREVPDDGLALRLAAKAAGMVEITATFESFDMASGVARFALTARARALPAHKLLNLLTGPLSAALRGGLASAGLPDDLVEIHQGEGEPRVLVQMSHAAGIAMPGARVRGFDVTGGQIHLDAQLPGAQ